MVNVRIEHSDWSKSLFYDAIFNSSRILALGPPSWFWPSERAFTGNFKARFQQFAIQRKSTLINPIKNCLSSIRISTKKFSISVEGFQFQYLYLRFCHVNEIFSILINDWPRAMRL